MTIIFTIILGSYCLFVLILILGWLKMERQKVNGTGKEKAFISVIIPFRNEKDNIDACIHSLAGLHYPQERFEVILVDDHSTDDTAGRIRSMIDRLPNFSLITAGSGAHGKKQALLAGISISKYDLIVTTDADCAVQADWLSYFSLFFENKETQMLIGGVKLEEHHSLFARLQRMEFSSLIGLTASALAWGRAILGNGANLAFRKSAFIQVNGYDGNLHIASGDDEFLIRKMGKRFPGGIVFINFSLSWVSTKPLATVTDFFNQRLRWAGKWKHNTDVVTQLLAVYILLVQFSFVTALILTFLNPSLISAIVGIKIVVEVFYFFLINRFQRTPFDLLAFLLLQFIYPVYVMVTGVLSLAGSYRWKGRNYK